MSRRQEPRIVDPATHPRRYVSLRVAAIYLELDPRTLGKYLESGTLAYSEFGKRTLHIKGLSAFTALTRGYRHHYELREVR